MKRKLFSITIFCIALAAPPGFAQYSPAAGAELKTRLALSDTQVEALTPVLNKSKAAQLDILSSYGISLESSGGAALRPGWRDAMAMKKKLEALRKDTLHAVDDILTDKQLDAFKRIQDEHRAALQQRIRGER